MEHIYYKHMAEMMEEKREYVARVNPESTSLIREMNTCIASLHRLERMY